MNAIWFNLTQWIQNTQNQYNDFSYNVNEPFLSKDITLTDLYFCMLHVQGVMTIIAQQEEIKGHQKYDKINFAKNKKRTFSWKEKLRFMYIYMCTICVSLN